MAHTKSKLSEIRQAKRLETALKLIELKRGYYVDLRPLVLTEKQANKLLKQVMDAYDLMGIKYHAKRWGDHEIAMHAEGKEKVLDKNALFSVRYGFNTVRPEMQSKMLTGKTITGLIYDELGYEGYPPVKAFEA